MAITMATDKKSEAVQKALRAFRDESAHLYIDGNGNWRDKRNRKIIPESKVLKSLGGFDEVLDAAYGHVVSSFELGFARSILVHLAGGQDAIIRIFAEVKEKWKDSTPADPGGSSKSPTLRNPEARLEAYWMIVDELKSQGVTLNRGVPRSL